MIEGLSPVELAYQDMGSGLPVILIHGFPLNRTIWFPMVEKMKEQAHLILPDLRGHGGSPVPDGVYTMRLMAIDLLHLMDRLKIQKAVLIGHSMGGYIGLDFAHAFPGRLSGLGLISSHPAADTPERKVGRLNNAEKILRKGVVKKFMEELAPRMTTKTEVAAAILPLMLKTTPQGTAGALAGMAEREDALDVLSNLNAPSLALVGEDDMLMPGGMPETMERLMRRGWLVRIQGAGHMPMLEYPEQTAAAIDQLLLAVKNISE